MPKTKPTDWMNVRRMKPASRVLALQRMRGDFEEDENLASARPTLAAAIELNQRAAEDQRTFKGESDERSLHQERARALDHELDRLLGVVYTVLEGAVRALPKDSEERAQAKRLFEAMFPHGLAAVTQVRFVEQHQLVNGILGVARDGADWRPEVQSLGLATFFNQIEPVNAAYGAALSDASAARTYDEVRELDTRAYRAYARVVIAAVAAYPLDEDAERLNAILAPVRAQEEEYREYRRRRRSGGAEDADDATVAEAGDAADDAGND